MDYQIKFVVILMSFFMNNLVIECSSIALASLCKDITSKSTELQLKTHLFCDYDPDVRPVTKDKNTTAVGLVIMPKFIEYDDLTDTLDVHCWIAMNWTDPHLTWDPKDFDEMASLYVPSTDLWVPDIIVHNAGDQDETNVLPDTGCGLNSDGGILCLPPMKYTAHCTSDYTNYPYDVQVCSVELASWSYADDEMIITNSQENDNYILSDFAPNPEWTILNVSLSMDSVIYKMNTSLSTSMFKMNFILQRRQPGMDVVYIAPAIVLMVMTLSVLWLDCYSTERIIVACINFICHLICIQDLHVRIPHNGGVLPKLLQFYENSFLLMAFTLILTVLLRELRSLTSPAPQWINSSTSFVLQSKAGQLLLLSILDPKASAFLESSADDNDDLVSSEKRDSTWSYVTLLLGWLAFISVFFAYLILLALYLPTSFYEFK